MNKPDKLAEQTTIDLSADVAGGIYSNLALITHSRAEFVVDFMSQLPGMPKPRVQSRLIMTPEHAKLLLRALEDNIARYEQNFGEIVLHLDRPSIPMGNMKGEA